MLDRDEDRILRAVDHDGRAFGADHSAEDLAVVAALAARPSVAIKRFPDLSKDGLAGLATLLTMLESNPAKYVQWHLERAVV